MGRVRRVALGARASRPRGCERTGRPRSQDGWHNCSPGALLVLGDRFWARSPPGNPDQRKLPDRKILRGSISSWSTWASREREKDQGERVKGKEGRDWARCECSPQGIPGRGPCGPGARFWSLDFRVGPGPSLVVSIGRGDSARELRPARGSRLGRNRRPPRWVDRLAHSMMIGPLDVR